MLSRTTQDGGSVVGHDGAHGGVDPSRTLMPALTVDTRLLCRSR
jgi:hypothetical protein